MISSVRDKLKTDALGNQGDRQTEPANKGRGSSGGVRGGGMGEGAAGAGGGPAAGAGAEHGEEAGGAELFAAMGEIDHNGRQGSTPGTDGSRESDAGSESQREAERGVSAEGLGIRADAEDWGKRRRG